MKPLSIETQRELVEALAVASSEVSHFICREWISEKTGKPFAGCEDDFADDMKPVNEWRALLAKARAEMGGES